MKSEHRCFTGASGRRGWEPIVLRRDPCSMRRKMVSLALLLFSVLVRLFTPSRTRGSFSQLQFISYQREHVDQ